MFVPLRSLRHLSLCFLLAATSDLWAQRLVREVRVRGVEKTAPDVVIDLAHLTPDQEITRALIREVTKRVESSELFESVEVHLEKPQDRPAERYADVVITVKEKISWFAAPVFQLSAGNIGGGFVYGESNLLGRNKKVFLFGQYGDKTRQFSAVMIDPSVAGTNFTLKSFGIVRQDLHVEYESESEVRQVQIRDAGGYILPGYRWDPNFTTYVGLEWRHFFYRTPEVLIPDRVLRLYAFDTVRNISLRIEFNYENVTSRQGLRNGRGVKLTTEISDNRFWSQTDYFSQQLEFKLWKILFRKHNLSYRFDGVLGVNLPFHKDVTMGGLGLRGYRSRQFRGDTQLAHSVEYLFPVYEVWKLVFRMAFFVDSALIFFKSDGVDNDNFRNGLGSGFRLYLKNIVIPLFGFDAGYGIERKDFALYLNIGTQF